MKVFVYLLAALMGYSGPSFSASVDVNSTERASADRLNEARRNLPGTIVVRTNRETGAVEVLRTHELLPANATSLNAIVNRNFIRVETNKPIRGELDRDTSRSNWFSIGFGYPYFGFGYNNYYNNYYGGYSYGYPNYSGYNYPYYPTYFYNNYYYPYYGYFNNYNSYGYYPYNYSYYRWWW